MNVTIEQSEYLPINCPVCGYKLDWQGVDLVCNNPNCGNKDYRDLQCWVNNLGKIDNLGDTLKFKFMDELGYTCIDDLYSKEFLTTDWVKGTQKKLFADMIDKLLNKPVNIVDALCALNIPRLGRISAKKLASKFNLLTCLMDYAILGTETDILELEGNIAKVLGPATASKIIENIDKVGKLKYIRSRILYEIPAEIEGKKVAITGKLNYGSRKEFQSYIESKGYQLTDNLKDCDYLITNNPNSNSSKNRRAKELGVFIISENDFMKVIGEV